MGSAQHHLPQPQPSNPPAPTPVSLPSQSLPLNPPHSSPTLFDPPQHPAPNNKSLRKRRGRPRSPVFTYYRRLVDTHGNFLGNECTFCQFVSRDRSENPTYLTRHIIRSCTAPAHIKNALAARFTNSNFSSATFNANVIHTTSTVAVPPSVSEPPPILNCSPHPMQPTQQPPLLHPSISEPISSSHHPNLHHTPAHAPPAPPSTAPASNHPNTHTPPMQITHHAAIHATSATVTVPPLPNPLPHESTADLPSNQHQQTQQHQLNPPLTNLSPTHQHSFFRPIGITKAKRGRPRSPALLHFRRIVDAKGSFVANHCTYCPFVSRDRSENSTLLLRHLISPSCAAPENVRQQLRMHRGAAKVLRKNNPLQPPQHAMLANGMLLPEPPTSRQDLVMTVLRFMLANDLPLDAAESPLFRDLMRCTRPPTHLQEEPHLPEEPIHPAVLDTKPPSLQPTHVELENYLAAHSTEHMMQPFNIDPPMDNIGAQLIIYFTDLSHEATTSARLQVTNKSDIRVAEESAAYIASVFRFVSGSHLSYLFSKNCHLNFSSNLAHIVLEAQQSSPIKYDQIIVSRPLIDVDKPRPIPRNDDAHIWMPDIVREVDILCQELLAQVPLLIRVQRRNNIIASYFQEEYSKAVSQEVFGRNSAEKEQLQHYRSFVASRPHSIQSCHVVETALHTYDLLRQAQSSHEDSQRLIDTRTFMTTLTEENCGNAPFGREIIRLLLSAPCRSDLKAFLSVMKPLTSLISLYSSKYDSPIRFSGAVYDMAELFRCPLILRARSLAYVLPDCVRTLRELYSDKLQEYENDLRSLRGHVACRLLGKGVDGCPPIADDISYIAAFLDPAGDLSNTKGITVEEVWRKAAQFVQKHYPQGGDMLTNTILDQLQEFHERSGRFSSEDLSRELSHNCDPFEWWQVHGHVAPELQCVALRILCVPTTAFPAVRHITNLNACSEDLQQGGHNSEMEKRRFLTWNLRLCVSRTKTETKAEGQPERSSRIPRAKEENLML